MNTLFRHIILSLLLLLGGARAVYAAQTDQEATANYEVLPDSSNFIHASLLVVSPGTDFYSVLGHSAIRLQCPSESLDYVFTYETTTTPSNLIPFLLGNAYGGFVAVPINRYIEDYKKEGRGIEELPLNLTLNEKRELWRTLDESIAKGITQPFDFIFHNCTSMPFLKVQSVLENESFDLSSPPEIAKGNRIYVHTMYRNSPWMEFLYLSFINSYIYKEIDKTYLLHPRLLSDVLKQSSIVGQNGTMRPALSAKALTRLKPSLIVKPSALTPVLVFSLLLVITLFVSALQLMGRKRPAKIFDILLLAVYSLWALLMLVMLLANTFETRWNWLIIPFNLIVPILLLTIKKQKERKYMFSIFALVLLLSMIAFPLWTGCIELPHQLILTSLLVRCVSNLKRY